MHILGYIALGIVGLAVVGLFAFALWPTGSVPGIAPNTLTGRGIAGNLLGGVVGGIV